jgi:hypothetical protein
MASHYTLPAVYITWRGVGEEEGGVRKGDEREWFVEWSVNWGEKGEEEME